MASNPPPTIPPTNQPVNPPANPPEPAAAQTMIEDPQQLLMMYRAKRLESQTNFYYQRIRENQTNSDFTYMASILIISAASLLAAVNAALGSVQWLAIVVATLPAFSALMQSFTQIYDWDRQNALYKDTYLSLLEVSQVDDELAIEDEQPLTVDTRSEFLDLVEKTEKVLTAEVNQWGQNPLERKK